MGDIKNIKDRKAFNFYRSYWEIAQELPDSDRLAFYDALMKIQFTKEETTLSGLAKLAFISQKYNIEQQISGFENVGKRAKIGGIINTPNEAPNEGGNEAPSVQVQVQEKGKAKDKGCKHITLQSCFTFDEFWDMYDKKIDSKKCRDKYDKISESDRAKIKETLPLYLHTITDKQYQKYPQTYLNGECWNDEIIIKKNNPEIKEHDIRYHFAPKVD